MFSLLKKPLVGIDIGSHSVKLAYLKQTKRGYELLHFGMVPLPPDTIVDGEVENPSAITDAIKNLLKAEKIPSGARHCVFSVSGQSVIIKKITVPLMSEDDLAESIQQEAEQYIPFDIEEVNVAFQVVKAEGEVPEKGEKAPDDDDSQMDVLLVAAKKDVIAEQSEIIKNSGLKPTVVDLDVFALENGYELAYGLAEDDTFALINVGASVTNVNIIENGITAYTRDIALGGNAVTESIQKNMGVGFRDAEKFKLGHLDESASKDDFVAAIKSGVAEICEEIKKTFEMFQRTSEGHVRRIYLCGGGALLDGITGIIMQEVGLDCELINPFLGMKINRRRFDEEYIEKIAPVAVVAIGLATRKLDES
ncbi:Type IV pilus biogenesis protein PilM [hydrothermal vent metagenome]|uniref:Type IV pilus biogenesis protein PilM n=1 Tax=hydrothermal vent metagenome TaxID=652676 RepID=A0A3B1BER4_9ZZZZ